MLDTEEGGNTATDRIAAAIPAAALSTVDVEISEAGGGDSATSELIEAVTTPNCVLLVKVVLEVVDKLSLEEGVETTEVRTLKERVGADNRDDCEAPKELPRSLAADVTGET